MAKATSPKQPKPEQAPEQSPIPKTLPDETTTQEGKEEDEPGIELPKKPPPPLNEP